MDKAFTMNVRISGRVGAGSSAAGVTTCKLPADRKKIVTGEFFCLHCRARLLQPFGSERQYFMRITIGGRLVPAAALLVLLFLAAPVDAASVTYEYGTEMVYQNAQPPFMRNSVRHRHSVQRHRHGRAGTPTIYYASDGAAGAVSVPDGGSTLAMMFASTALLLLGYHRLGCKRVAA
jgi:hypothetical protein